MDRENQKRPKTVSFFTLGCKVNQYDTEAVTELFKEQGYDIVSIDECADVYVVNTCTVTHLSDRKCRQILRKTKRLNSESVLVAMGCYAQSAGEKIKAEVEEVDLIVGTNKRSDIVHMVEAYKAGQEASNYVENIMEIDEFEELKIGQMDERTRVYLKIQEGCNNYCTYCIIPYVRGKIRSRKLENVIEEAKRLGDAGFKEIVLTGIHVASYGKDLEDTNLIDAIKEIHKIETIERIRIGSIEPVVVTDEFVGALKELPKLCRHFHLSLQSGCDTVLKRMNRKYTTEAYKASVREIRSIWPDVAITTDIIVGFPGETDEEFEETVNFVKEIGFAQVHIFPFSPREGTVAAKMQDQVDAGIKEKRAKALKQVTEDSADAFKKQHIGATVDVLVEKVEAGIAHGYTSNYLKVEFPAEAIEENTLYPIVINQIKDHTLLGEK
ncbi:MAG: tRNA (N(6)-L-threonylcarbamoyladenosine(37)-C(2))-methylthiotransferase MtaB [Cellulosilyticaceae bacterium]